MEVLSETKNKALVIIDYAHTPAALKSALKSIQEIIDRERIITLFGCGGDRDKKKRPLMARIANKYCSKIYITDDNPRNEDPQKIRKVLLKYIPRKKSFNIGNRRSAIEVSIKKAIPGEIILVAGKGHEEIQIYKTNYFLRGLIIPPGEHQLTLDFKPSSFSQGILISWLSVALQLLLGLWVGIMWYRSKE